GVLVNNVAPGWVDNDLNREVFSDAGFKKTVIESIPIRRIASSEDVAGAVLFLASDLSRHITGSTISVNGGAVLV
ncbi:MAG TPA: SDR family oxidoreductase, partial [bacterium]|nr:SDR family oxidoreductase [bacterium]